MGRRRMFSHIQDLIYGNTRALQVSSQTCELETILLSWQLESKKKKEVTERDSGRRRLLKVQYLPGKAAF